MQPGSKIGKYEVLEKIGQGSFGVVYKGRDPFIKRIVAIKVCSADDEDLRKRFFREAQIVGTLQHRNLVTVYDFGIQDEAPFMVQEYLDGEDLADIIRRKDDLPLPQRLGYLIQVAAGLAFAHEEDVIHRDIKPGNIRVLPEDRVKIMDFGIAKLTSSKTRLTQAGTTIGTAGYLSPEQLQATELDARTDIFSFGVLAYELLSFERPFRGNTFSKVAYQILYTPPMPLSASWPNCPLELERIISRCLEKRREDRYSNCGEIIADLEKLLEMDKDGVTEKLGSDDGEDPKDHPGPSSDLSQAYREPSPEATVAMRLPILPPLPPRDSSVPQSEATSRDSRLEEQEPPAQQEEAVIDSEAPSPRTIILPPRESSRAEDAGPAFVESPAPEPPPNQVLSSIDDMLPTSPAPPPPHKPIPKVAKPAPSVEISRTAVEPKTPASPKKEPQPASSASPAKSKPEDLPASLPSPWVRAREQFGSLPPGLRKAAFAAGAALLLLMVVIALWPASENRSPIDTASVVEPKEQIVEDDPITIGASMGQLRIDSTPWAYVIAVESADGESLEIPVGTTTPTHLDVPQGTWIVTLEPGIALDTPEPSSTSEVEVTEDSEATETDTESEIPDGAQTCQVTVIEARAANCRVQFLEFEAVDYFGETGWWN